MQPLGLLLASSPSAKSYISMTPLLYLSVCDKHTKFQKCELAEFFGFFRKRRRSLSCIRDGGEFLQKLIGFGADPNQTIEILVQHFDQETLTYNPKKIKRYLSNLLLTTMASNDCFPCIEKLIECGANPYQKGYAYLQRQSKFFYGNALELVDAMAENYQIRVDYYSRVIYQENFHAIHPFKAALEKTLRTYKSVHLDNHPIKSYNLQKQCKNSLLQNIQQSCQGLKLMVDFFDDIDMPPKLRQFLKE